MKQNKFPPGSGEKGIQNVISDPEQQREDETVAEDRAASQNEFDMLMEALTELGPAVCEWIIGTLIDNQ